MTGDTLREECKQLAEKLALSAFIQDDTDVLLAFARAQQAKGLREAAAVARRSTFNNKSALPGGNFGGPEACEYLCGPVIADYLEAQATAREQGA